MVTGVKKPGLWDSGMDFDVRVQNVLEIKTWSDRLVWPLGLRKPCLTDQGVATGVTKFHTASGEINSFLNLNVSDHIRVSQTVFFLLAFRSWMSVTIPQTQSVRPWYGHWHPGLKRQKKVCETVLWSLTSYVEKVIEKNLKKPGLWDRGMAIDILVQNVLEKKSGLTDQGMTGVP